jgi:hypothetical protein
MKQNFFDKVYIKNDSEQMSHALVGVLLCPGHIKYQLSTGTGEVIELYEAEVCFEIDEAVRLNYKNKQDELD